MGVPFAVGQLHGFVAEKRTLRNHPFNDEAVVEVGKTPV